MTKTVQRMGSEMLRRASKLLVHGPLPLLSTIILYTSLCVSIYVHHARCIALVSPTHKHTNTRTFIRTYTHTQTHAYTHTPHTPHCHIAELMHLYGINHCVFFDCVMRGTGHLVEVRVLVCSVQCAVCSVQWVGSVQWTVPVLEPVPARVNHRQCVASRVMPVPT